MARGKVAQNGVEVFAAPLSTVQVSEYGVEVWMTYTATSPSTPTGAGVSQHGVEVFYSPAIPATVSGYGVEVFYLEGQDDAVAGSSSGTTSFGYVV